MKKAFLPAFLALASLCLGQVAPSQSSLDGPGVPVTIKTIASFQGIAPNQLVGIGLVTGLAGTGDTKKYLQTQKAAVNLLRTLGIEVDSTQSESKNIALVALTADLPPFASPGGRIDVTASTLGDCTSLRGGTLLSAQLKYPTKETIYATVSGAIAVGGFSEGAGGNSASKGFTTVGKLPGGGLIQLGWTTQYTFGDKMYLGIRESDATTSMRIETAIRRAYPELRANATDPGTVEITVPTGANPNAIMAKVESLTVFVADEARIVIDEKTGTVVIGGDVRLGPCSFVSGSLSVNIADEPFVSQPGALSGGTTVAGSTKTVNVTESRAHIANVRPNATVSDLAAIFRALHLKASDVMNVLQGLHAQGALKARLEVR